jgi:hypothetical protein
VGYSRHPVDTGYSLKDPADASTQSGKSFLEHDEQCFALDMRMGQDIERQYCIAVGMTEG